MAKDPAMLWYWSDWHSGTITLSRFLKGCYMDVLHAQFNSGHLTLEEIKTVLGSDFGTAWPALLKKFKVDETGKFFNERLEEEKVRRANFTASRRRNLQTAHMDKHMPPHTAVRMENVNENKNVLGIKGGGGGMVPRGTPDFDEQVVVKLSDEALDLIDAMCGYFDVKRVTTSTIYNTAFDYATTLLHRNELKIASMALKNYMAYKNMSQEKKHSMSSWMGTKEKYFQDGQWASIDWDSKLKNIQHDRTNGKGSSADAGSRVITGGKAFGNIRRN